MNRVEAERCWLDLGDLFVSVLLFAQLERPACFPREGMRFHLRD